jgi:deazaflavin-dependent oxidoreductase (nitroreductase family)
MSTVADINAWNDKFMEGFRAAGGRVGGNFEGVPLLILHTTGAKSGEPRMNPLVYQVAGRNFVVFASGGGAARNPDWYYNLLADRVAAVEVGTETLAVTARVAEGEERDWYWDLQKRSIPAFAEHEHNTSRRIPVIVLEPEPE